MASRPNRLSTPKVPSTRVSFLSGLSLQVLLTVAFMGILVLLLQPGWFHPFWSLIDVQQPPSVTDKSIADQLLWSHRLELSLAFVLGGLFHFGVERLQRWFACFISNQATQAELPSQSVTEVQLSDVLDHAIASIASFKIDATGHWEPRYYSAGSELVFGYTPEEFFADQELWPSRLVPDDLKTWLLLKLHLLECDRPITFEYRFRHKDGTLRWVAETLNIHPDPIGNYWWATAFSVDITQQKQAEAALLQREEWFRSIFENAGIGMMLTDPNQIPIKTNAAAQRLFGYTDAELCQMPFTQYTHPEDIALDVSLNQELLAGKRTSYQIEKRYFHKSGELVWAKLTVSTVWDSSDRPLFTIAMIENISAQRQAEQQLKAANAEMRALFAAMDELIFVYDRTGRNLRTLASNERLLYLPAEAKTGKTLHEIFPTDLADQFLGYIQQALDTQQTVRTEYCFPIRGEQVWSDAVLSPIDANTVIWTIRDLTQRKQAEAALQKRERYLATLVEVQQCLLDLKDDQQNPYAPILELLGQVSGASRVYVFENHLDEEGQLLTSQRAEWCASGIASRIENSRLQNVLIARDLPRWVALLSQGEIVTGNVDTFPAEERLILEAHKICSILVLPMQVNGQWVGFIGFDNCFIEKIWEPSEVYLLQAAAAAIALSRERFLINQELRTTNAELKALFGAMDELILVLDGEGRHLKIQSANFDLLYKPSEERLGKTLHEIFPTEQADWFLGHIQTVLRTKQTLHLEYSLQIEGLGEIWSDASVSFIDDNRVIWAIRDITERKRSEEVIRQSEIRFQRLAANLPGVIYRYLLRSDGSDAVTYVSLACQEVYELSPEKILQDVSLIWQSIHPEDVPAIKLAIAESAKALQPFFWEGRVVTPAGQTKWLRKISRPERQENGDVLWDGLVIDVSDRKQTEEALQTSESRFRSLVSNLPGAVFRCHTDEHWTLEYISNGVKELLGYEASSLIENRERTFASTEHPEDSAMIRQMTMQAVAEQRPYELEYRCIHADGSIRWVAERAQPLMDEQGNVLLDGILIDITDRKQAEGALKDSEDRFRSLVSNIPGAVYRCLADQRWTMLFISDAIAQISGYPASDLMQNQQRSFASIIHPEDREKLLQAVPLILQQHNYRLEYRIVHADGGVRWVYDQGQAVVDASGQLRWRDGAIFDVSDRKQAEFALKKQAQRERLMTQVTQRIRQTLDLEEILFTTVAEVRQFLQADRVLIYQFNLDWSGNFVAESVAAGWVPILPLESEDLLHQQNTVMDGRCLVRQRSMGCDRPASQDPTHPDTYLQDTYLQDTCGGNYIKGISYFCVEDVHQQGFDDCYLELLARFQAQAYITVPIFQNTIQGNILWGLMGTYQNTGPRAWQPDEINFVVNIATQLGVALQQAELLAQTLKQSTELKHAKEAADAANRAKSLFLASMSHELRTPLNAILGFTQLMANDENTTPAQQENLSIINRSGEHLLGLINDVLDMSKIEAGKIVLNERQTNFHELLDTLRETFHFRASAKGIALSFERSPHIPQLIETDDGKLCQILSNLIGNAIKFTETGSVRLSVRQLSAEMAAAEFLSGEQQQHISDSVESVSPMMLQFAIQDTGPGMAPDELKNLFNPFVQTETGLRSQQGTGLGLSITKRLVQFLGGEIGVQSERGRGTLFWVKLPVKIAQGGILPSSDLPQQVIALAPGQPTYRILVVDDAKTNRLLLLRLLEPLGFAVKQAEDGETAIALWETWQPHLIWMDMQMPRVDGYVATRQIRLLEQAREASSAVEPHTSPGHKNASLKSSPTVIIALTANALAEEREQILATGCNDILNKPFRRQALLQKIAEHLAVQYLYADAPVEESTIRRLSATPERNSMVQITAHHSHSVPQNHRVAHGDSLGHAVSTVYNNFVAYNNSFASSSGFAIANFEGLPGDWLERIYHAATRADARQLLQLAEALPAHQDALRSVIVTLVQQFRFDLIMDSARQSFR